MNAEPVTGRRLGIGLAVAVALLTSGCAAGQVAATANQKAVESGVEANAGTLAIRGLLIQSPVRQDALSTPPGTPPTSPPSSSTPAPRPTG